MKREGKKTASSNAIHSITIQYRTQTSDGEGGFNYSWFNRPNIWAEISPISAKQKFEYASINVKATHRIKVNGNLTLQSNTKRVSDNWSINYTGISGPIVDVYYRIEYHEWQLISASEINTGLFNWVIPLAAIGKRVAVRVRDIADVESYYITGQYNIVPADIRDGIPSEHDRIMWTLNGTVREFEILTVENIQERDIQLVITCVERRD